MITDAIKTTAAWGELAIGLQFAIEKAPNMELQRQLRAFKKAVDDELDEKFRRIYLTGGL